MKVPLYPSLLRTLACLGAGAVMAHAVIAASSSKNPTSKFFVSDLTGESEVNLGDKIVPLEKKSVFSAQGTIIETKPKSNNSLVYSNGTGIFIDENSRLELRRFAQEPFTPNRIDIETEPSISQTQAYLAHGVVGLCTSKMVAGSSMTYQTPLANVNIRGKRIVIDSGDDVTKVSMIEGDCTVRGGELDMGGHNLHAGEQAIIRRGASGEANSVEIIKIPSAERNGLEDKSSLACMSRQTVYFEVRERTSANSGGSSAFDSGEEPRTNPLITTPGNTPSKATTPNLPTRLEIVPVEIVPGNLPLDFTVSPARL
jgi:FecR protein